MMILNWLDWVIVIIISCNVIQGFRRGLVLCLLKTGGLVAGLFVAVVYYPRLGTYFANQFLLIERITPITSFMLERWQPVRTLNNIFPKETSRQLIEQLNSNVDLVVVNVLAFLALFLLTAGISGIVGKAISAIVKNSILSPINRVGGMLFGLIIGYIYVLLLLLLMAPFQQLMPNMASPENPIWDIFPHGVAFQASVLLQYFQPVLDLIGINVPVLTLPDSVFPSNQSGWSI